ncbi:MAG: class I SAM-dependent methyltransferase [Bacteroidetes bacterium]|nr:MAG: class I SAM-dependent methyltransferase [Bacteroidota bacterium]
MIDKEQKRAYREELFRHLDGIVTAPTAHVLWKKGVWEALLSRGRSHVGDLSEDFGANEGYLNVALRVLASQGWLNYELDNQRDEVYVSPNSCSRPAFEHLFLYDEVVELMKFSGKFHPRKFELEPFEKMEKIYRKYYEQYHIQFSAEAETCRVQKQMLKHVEGVLAGPTIVLLGMSGMFHKYFMEASFRPEEFHKDSVSFGKMLDFFAFLGWFEKKNSTFRFTEKGLFFAKRASAYGVTVSYLPTLRNLEELIFGDPNALRDVAPGEPEKHVDREMNVWGSGGAHASYFRQIDEIVVDLFNKPIEEQPRGILDMGCGNGAFLIHLFDVIEKRTLRGEMLEEHPLFLVGVDYNEAALKATRKNLIQADIWAKVIWGDIGKPEVIARDLKEDYNIELGNLLNVRTFLDHNRIWEEPPGITKMGVGTSTGAFAYRGKRLNNYLVEQNLRMHFAKWKPFVEKFGLLVIELHTLPPALTAAHLGETAATAYDATHGYSDQYILEIEVFHRMAKEAGLHLNPRYFAKFPNSELATISINFFTGSTI